MTASNDTSLSGEQRLRLRRRKFFTYCAIGFLVALVAGMAIGTASNMFVDGELPMWILLLGWIIVVAGFIWFTVAYYRRVDELDLSDNLWANTVGLYTYFIAFASWELFHEAGLTGEPRHWLIAAVTLAALFASYGLRKLGWR